jgi:hypothetical protein
MTDLLLTQQAEHEYTGNVKHVHIFFQNPLSSAK